MERAAVLSAVELAWAAILVAVIGPAWATVQDATGRRRIEDPNDLVRLELTAALERGIPVIPTLVQGAVMPRVEDLPVPLRTLARRQALEMSHERWQYDVGRLVSVVRRVDAGASPHGSGVPSATPSRRGRGMPTVVAAGVLGVAALIGLGAGGVILPSRGEAGPNGSAAPATSASSSPVPGEEPSTHQSSQPSAGPTGPPT